MNGKVTGTRSTGLISGAVGFLLVLPVDRFLLSRCNCRVLKSIKRIETCLLSSSDFLWSDKSDGFDDIRDKSVNMDQTIECREVKCNVTHLRSTSTSDLHSRSIPSVSCISFSPRGLPKPKPDI